MAALVRRAILMPKTGKLIVESLDRGVLLAKEVLDQFLTAGFKLLFVPTARLWHRVSASSGGAMNPWKVYQRLRANVMLWSRHARGLASLTWIPALLAQQAAYALLLIARGHAAAAAAVPRALADALTGKNAAEVKL